MQGPGAGSSPIRTLYILQNPRGPSPLIKGSHGHILAEHIFMPANSGSSRHQGQLLHINRGREQDGHWRGNIGGLVNVKTSFKDQITEAVTNNLKNSMD